MPETDERLAELCEQVWNQLRDLDPYDILVIHTALAADVIAAQDNPERLLECACELLTRFARETVEADKPQRPHLRLVPKEPV